MCVSGGRCHPFFVFTTQLETVCAADNNGWGSHPLCDPTPPCAASCLLRGPGCFQAGSLFLLGMFEKFWLAFFTGVWALRLSCVWV
jgi:hypothetical protein